MKRDIIRLEKRHQPPGNHPKAPHNNPAVKTPTQTPIPTPPPPPAPSKDK